MGRVKRLTEYSFDGTAYYAIVPEVTKGIVDIAFEQFERSKKNEQST